MREGDPEERQWGIKTGAYLIGNASRMGEAACSHFFFPFPILLSPHMPLFPTGIFYIILSYSSGIGTMTFRYVS